MLQTTDSYPDELSFVFYAGDWRYTRTVDLNLQVNTWYHVVVVFDETIDKVYFYINGSLQTEADQTYNMTADEGLLRIGDSGASEFWDGLIDEVRVYNRALTADEVKRLYNMGR